MIELNVEIDARLQAEDVNAVLHGGQLTVVVSPDVAAASLARYGVAHVDDHAGDRPGGPVVYKLAEGRRPKAVRPLGLVVTMRRGSLSSNALAAQLAGPRRGDFGGDWRSVRHSVARGPESRVAGRR